MEFPVVVNMDTKTKIYLSFIRTKNFTENDCAFLKISDFEKSPI